MGRSLAFLLAVFTALLSQQGNAAVLLFDGEAGQNELAADRPVPTSEKCGQQVANLCKEKMTLRQDLLFGGVVNKLNCVVENQKELDEDCFYTEVEQTLDEIVNKQGSKCHDELRAKCGKQIDELKKAIQRTSIIGTVKGTVDVVECIISHAEDLWDKCKPGQKMEDTIGAIVEESAEVVEPEAELDCATRAEELCPPTSHKILGLGYSLGCLSNKAKELGNDCLIEQMSLAVEEMEAFADRPCHDELRKKCGKQIDQLKKEIQDTSILGILKSSVDVVQCIAQNAEDLWKKCNPFQEVAEDAQAELDLEPPYIAGSPTPPTRKPTRRPTHRPTKKPTPKPTTQKPTKSQPTGKPTPRAIAEAVVYDDFLNLEEVRSMDSPKMHEEPAHMLRDMDDDFDGDFMDDEEDMDDEDMNDMDMMEPAEQMDVKVTSIQVDMDACVRSARQHCSAEVAAFNESPFDRSRFQRLNDCIDAKSSLIEADCVTKTQSSGSWTSWFSSGRGYRRGYHGRGYDDDHHGHHGHHHHHPHHHHNHSHNHSDCRNHSHHHHHHRHHNHSFDASRYRSREGGFWAWSKEFSCPYHGHQRRKHAIAVVAGFVVFFVAFFVGRRVCLRRRQAAVEAAQRPAVNGGLYQPLKSDDAPAVPVTNMV